MTRSIPGIEAGNIVAQLSAAHILPGIVLASPRLSNAASRLVPKFRFLHHLNIATSFQ
jgi:hypothetical protein